jgi:SAM-dependent methyltransferase
MYVRMKHAVALGYVALSKIFGGPLHGPPRAWPPRDLVGGYTMGGRVEIVYGYFDDTKSHPLVYETERVDEVLSMIARREVGVYRGIDRWLYTALEQHPIDRMRVAIMGSADQGFGPWYECVCLHYGGRPTSIDYNAIEFRDSRIAFAKAPLDLTAIEPFDAAFSISSFEHDGLGRYGDPLDPDGDLKAMQQMKELVKPGGLLYLAVPVGRDKVAFNAHRIYGRMRLPLLLFGWQPLASIGFEDEWMDRDTGFGGNPTTPQGELVHPEYPEYDPIFVLRNVELS